MADNSKDRRVQKTRKLLQDSLISLIAEKGFDAVTIQELLDRANVGRSTFYLHYDNKDELLHSCFEEFINRLNQHNIGLLRTHREEAGEAIYITGFFHFVESNYSFFKSLMGEHGVGMFDKGIQDYVFVYIERMIKKQDIRKKLKPAKADILTHYVTNAVIGVLKWWVRSDMPCTSDELGQYVLRQITANIENALITTR